MAENSRIEWTDHTFNPWIGCTKVDAGCLNCYAEADFDKRKHFAQWGPHGTRVLTSEANWRKPIQWDKAAREEGVRRRVFCASLADVFEEWGGEVRSHAGRILHLCQNCEAVISEESVFVQGLACACGGTAMPMDMQDVRRRLFELIDKTPNLDWLLLTKRPENIRRMMPPWKISQDIYDASSPHLDDSLRGRWHYRDNVWLGTSISDQASADTRVPELLKCRDLSPVLFLSIEPLLGPIDLRSEELRKSLVYQADYYCGSCAEWKSAPAADDHCPNCGDEHSQETCPSCGYDGEMEMVCPDCGVDGGNGGLSHADCCQREIESQHGLGIDWVIVGGESGHGARPMHPDWVRSIRNQCQAAGVPFFFKQGSQANWSRFKDAESFPEDLRIREFPEAHYGER